MLCTPVSSLLGLCESVDVETDLHTAIEKLRTYVGVEETLIRHEVTGFTADEIRGIEAFLVLQNQLVKPFSVFRKAEAGREEPAFPRRWVARQLARLAKTRTQRQRIVFFRANRAGWANPGVLRFIGRMTVAEFLELSTSPPSLRLRLAEALETHTARLNLPRWDRIVLDADQRSFVVLPEYPGWVIHHVIHSVLGEPLLVSETSQKDLVDGPLLSVGGRAKRTLN